MGCRESVEAAALVDRWGYVVAVAYLLALYKAVMAGFLRGSYLSATPVLWMIYVASTITLFA